MRYGLQTNSGLRSAMVDKMEQQLLRQGLSTSHLDPTHKIENPTLKHYDKQCPICKAHFSSKNLRCPKCDIIVAGKKPTGTDKAQKKYITEYAQSMDEENAQRKLIRKHRRDSVKDNARS